jgi:hypothetical protein
MAGGTAQLLSHFVDGLKVYQQCGPPKISSIYMTNEEVMQAVKFNTEEGEMKEFTMFGQLEQLENDSEDDDQFSNRLDDRCPACRECLDCKSSDNTEKISLREESEQFKINKSVKLDIENKRIQCTLPLIGKEKEFLTCSRDRAQKILMQV